MQSGAVVTLWFFFLMVICSSAAAMEEALSQSELQYEVGNERIWEVWDSDALLAYQEAPYYYSYYGYQVFDLTRQGKEKKRAELRQSEEWSVAGTQELRATMRLESSSLDEFTWMQLHRKEDYSVKPPLRLVWVRDEWIAGGRYRDYLVAVFYHVGQGYTVLPLRERPSGDFSVRLVVSNYQVYVVINDQLLAVENVSAWSGYDCYFKLGLYTSGNSADYGQARVGVRELTYLPPAL
ncbi:polysaccharide lyase family 7 protein [Alcanivorax sp. DP30]|uniref:polysaccharide lyase family 7 protein n=1 Tax=Alcanivorax sp. DP30 TaxID=2606217 RepID=UPI001368439F|nr:polysaccharide lyase family 7 protein [Alcanivorax sp. DP30]MZR61447.1 hypothetical protein [Alcanivorax sp. DP30]